MITLCDMPLALNCYKVRLLFALLGVDYRREPIDLLEDEHKTPEFLALNPFGQLPVPTEGALVLRDSQAILVWTARKFGDDTWMPSDPDKEAIVNGWLSAADISVRPHREHAAGRARLIVGRTNIETRPAVGRWSRAP